MDVVKQQKALNRAVLAIKKGEVIICPTDTVYGFLADATNKKAVNKIYKIKNRPKLKPLPLFVSSIKKAKELSEIDKKKEKILKKYWPGKYTFVLKRKKGIKVYDGTKDTIAIRIPKYKLLNNLLNKINKPLVQTSVNVSGEKTLTKISDILEKFGKTGLAILIIDGGDLKKAKASKIFDFTQQVLTRLR